MPSELAKLAHLQDVEQQAAALSARLAAYPQKIAARQAALGNAARELEENLQALNRETAARRRMESDTADLRLKIVRYRAQLDNVQSDSQARALEHQLAFCKQEIDRIEELEFSSLMDTEALETSQRGLHETLANLKLALAAEKADAEAGQLRDRAERATLIHERDQVRVSLEPSVLAEYDRISAARKPAVARVEHQRCSACQMMVRPQRWNEIREGAVHFCESCGRFLFYDPAVDLRDAIDLPVSGKKPVGLVKNSAPQQAAAAGSDPFAHKE